MKEARETRRRAAANASSAGVPPIGDTKKKTFPPTFEQTTRPDHSGTKARRPNQARGICHLDNRSNLQIRAEKKKFVRQPLPEFLSPPWFTTFGLRQPERNENHHAGIRRTAYTTQEPVNPDPYQIIHRGPAGGGCGPN